MANPPYLQPEEDVTVMARRHPFSIVDDLLLMFTGWALVVGAALVVFLGVVDGWWLRAGLPIIITVTLLLLYGIMLRAWRVKTSRYVVTPERVYKSYGRIRFFMLQTTYDKVTDLHVKQSLWGRWRGFGTVRVMTAGTGIALEGVPDPFGFKRRIEASRSAFLQALVGTSKASAPVAPEAVDDTVIWHGRPMSVSVLGAIVSGSMFLLAGLAALIATLIVNPPYAGAGGFLLLLGLITLVPAIIHLRHTRYEIRARGVVVTKGWLTKRRVETTFSKVTDVTTYQPLLGRLFGYGNITINTAGSNEAPVVFAGLPDPDQVKARIDAARRQA